MPETLQGQARLISEVLEKGICVGCGACVGLCPYMEFVDGSVAVMDTCKVSNGWRCVSLCPRIHGEEGQENDGPIGPFKRILAARTTLPGIQDKVQYGGVVTTSLMFCLDEGLIRAAVLSAPGTRTAPHGIVARDRGRVVSCAGSRYSASGSLSALNLALKQGETGLAVVGLPCQIQAIDRMKEVPDIDIGERIELKIGLFCTWALDHKGLRRYLDEKGVREPISFDIPPPPAEVFLVKTHQAAYQFPLQEIREYIQSGCFLCEDMTAQGADISVGTLEGREGWNTVVIRTQRGEDLVNSMVNKGALEVADYPQEVLSHLMDAAAGKRKKARQMRKKSEEAAP